MFSIAEQFSAATKSNIETQLNFLNTIASKAVDSAEKVIALNISTTKESVEKTSSAARQLLEVRDPGQFFSPSNFQAPNLDQLLAYSRQLFSIASAAQADLIQSAKEQIKTPAMPTLTLAASVTPVTPVAPKAAAPVAQVDAVKPAPAPVVKAEPKVEAKVEVKPEVKPEAKVEVQPEAKVEVKPEVKPEVKEVAEVKAKPAEAVIAEKKAEAVEAAPVAETKSSAKVATSPNPPAAKVNAGAKASGGKK